MDSIVLSLFAVVPIIIIFVLMVGMKWSAVRAMPIAFVVSILLSVFIWRSPLNWVAAAVLNGVNTALNIGFIVFGALLLLFTLDKCGALNRIKAGFHAISPDKRIQAIIIAWFFGSFIEAAAGFGTPAALVAPLLLSLGFPALASVMVGLIANSTSVSFGAVGTPTLIGLGSVLNNNQVIEDLASHGLNFSEFMHQIGVWTAVIHIIPGILIPSIMVLFLPRFFGKTRSIKEGLDILPFSIFAGLSFLIPYLLIAIFLGPEFPSLLGSLIGMSITVFAVKKNFLTPKKIWDFPERSEWEKNWMGTISAFEDDEEGVEKMSLLKAWLPYLLIGVLLVATRLKFLPFNGLLKIGDIGFGKVLGTDIAIEFGVLSNPGIFPFIPIALISFWVFKMGRDEIRNSWGRAISSIKSPLIALVFAVSLVQVMMQSGFNLNEYPSMLIVMAESMSDIFKSSWPFVDSFVGIIGSFMAGSNTVSNMLFGVFQYSVGQNLEVSKIIMVSLQNVGGAIGNMICVHNIIAACATVGLVGVEGIIIRRNLIPAIFVALIIGVIGLLLTYFFVPELF